MDKRRTIFMWWGISISVLIYKCWVLMLIVFLCFQWFLTERRICMEVFREAALTRIPRSHGRGLTLRTQIHTQAAEGEYRGEIRWSKRGKKKKEEDVQQQLNKVEGGLWEQSNEKTCGWGSTKSTESEGPRQVSKGMLYFTTLLALTLNTSLCLCIELIFLNSNEFCFCCTIKRGPLGEGWKY